MTEEFPAAEGDQSGPRRLNHMLWYGQSNSIGATLVAEGSRAISLAQPYCNLTFAGGPRAWDKAAGQWSFLPLKPLVEDDDITGGAGGARSQLGETPCSGGANHASRLLARQGIAPSEHVILASTAGRGSYRIDQLEKGAPWYAHVLAQLAAARSASEHYVCRTVSWVQGERDADEGTPHGSYLEKLDRLQRDLEADIQAVSGQTEPVSLLVTQVTAYARSHDDTARAQFDVQSSNPRIFIVVPSYRLPYEGHIHYLNVGAQLCGIYHGRAYAALLRGERPQMLRPLDATLSEDGMAIRVRFEAPTLPLVLGPGDGLAAVENNGFSVKAGDQEIPIASVVATGAEVRIALLAPAPDGVHVRYGLDHAGAGRSVAGEGYGNLRDSTAETVTIEGTDYRLYNAAPAFECRATRG